ncbi:hypothetical protein HY489_05015 [Candidatus Woesearchaeota archaeon]|nr:hypothetical protein [Candidatus Woesearchaeota archaeon]
MTGIHWLIWLVVGLFVTITSTKLGGKLTMFLWVGILFIVIGIGKLAYKMLTAPKESHKGHAPQVHKTTHHEVHNGPKRYCPKCGSQAIVHDNYCKHCGMRLR